ncbi:MAG: pyridoxamine 5'-phosphate oxidase family protein [Cohaesibacter sp.]|nr:pyridoxamine 5'-phosphate oxidase family protein [Cohaesibacter sp.]
MAILRTAQELRALYDLPKPIPVNKEIDHLDDYCQRFIALSPFAILATMGQDGLIDISPRGDAPGFVEMESETCLLLPDRRGNNRIDALLNLVENPACSLLFLVPGMDETLRVQGLAQIDSDPLLCERFVIQGKVPKSVLRIQVREVYFQCAKALMRSRLWAGDYAIERKDFPAMGEIMKAHTQLPIKPETREEMLQRYKDIIY